MSLVFFDFDKTLTKIDTTLLFASILASEKNDRKRFVLLLCIYIFFRFRLFSNYDLKKWFVKLFIRDEKVEYITNITKKFFDEYLGIIENKKVVDRLLRCAAKGDEVYLVSANFDFFLNPLKDIWPIRGIIATQAEIKQELFTGSLVGNVCHASEKLLRVISFFGEKKVKEAIAYGDNRDDLHLLEFTRKGYLIQLNGNIKKNSIFRIKDYIFLSGKKGLILKDNLRYKTKILPIRQPQ